ncbi:MAG: isoprenylcysteine carboxylmethyltransferase family protein [Candidatus Marinimicrobia bacterium]|nr:isoprenylcysteine carboxylmethyltransferase family protein [Candidatus Neomarinimicrobiota bacterium]
MDIRQFFFKNRSYTPIPLVLILIYFARPTFLGIVLGLLVILLGESIRIYANRFAGGATRTTRVGAAALCTAGPFTYVRNPLYVGNMIIYSGVVFFAGAPSVPAMLILTWAFFLIQYSLIVALEEETLTEKFGEQYRVFCKYVPRIVPRFTAWQNADDRIPHTITNTLKIEKRTLQNILVILIIILIRSVFL